MICEIHNIPIIVKLDVKSLLWALPGPGCTSAPLGEESVLIPILQMRKLSPEMGSEVSKVPQWGKWDLNQDPMLKVG